jgi:tetratricopeptide (TPR) repeat protein
MIRIFFLIVLLFYGIGRPASLRQSENQISLLSKTIDLVFADSFLQAYELAADFPDSSAGRPIYHLLIASVVHAEMFDAENYDKERIFKAHIDSCISVLNRWTGNNPDDPWGFFFLGSAHAYKSVRNTQMKKWLSAFIDGWRARGKFARALELDSTLYDAYTGLGNYHYWSSAILGKYLPFLPDKREQGLRELRLAADSSLFSGKPALTGLAWAYIHKKRMGRAVRIGIDMYNVTGGGRNSLWILGGAYWRMGNLPLAAQYYGELLKSFQSTGNQNYYNIVLCRYRRGVSLHGMGKDEEARSEFETILSYEVSRDIKKRLDKIYKKTRQRLEEMDRRSPERKSR